MRQPTAVLPAAARTFHHARSCCDHLPRLISLPQDPSNDVYRKAVEMTKKAPELHKELQRQLAAQGEVRIAPLDSLATHPSSVEGAFWLLGHFCRPVLAWPGLARWLSEQEAAALYNV
jgi:Plant specific mitochondrial import receptor subunit TOM20